MNQPPPPPTRNRVSDVDRWRMFVTQTDWTGPVMRESWHGHGNPWNRIAMFIHLSALCSAMALAFHGFQNWPILYPFLTIKEWNQIKESHSACVSAICESVEDIQLECRMTWEQGIVMSPVDIDRVPLPRECHDAIRLTFGDDFEQNLLMMGKVPADPSLARSLPKKEIDLIHFRDMSQGGAGSYNNIPIFQVLPDECLVQESLLEYLFLGDAFGGVSSGAILIDFVDSFSMQPGDRERIMLRSYACPNYMSQQTRKDIIPKLKQVYELLMSWRRSGAVCLMYWINLAYFSALCATRTFTILIPGFCLWLLMPKYEIRGKRISWFTTVSTLLLLTTLTEEGTSQTGEMIRTGILVTTALSFGNQKAAMEWCFLFFLSYMDLRSLSEGCDEFIYQSIDHLDVIKKMVFWIDFIVSNLIPGYGLWKLVLLYAIYLSFPPKRLPEEPKRD